MTSISVVVVDDEALARARIVRMLGAEPDFKIVAECAGGAESVETILRLSPSLIFLDVQMPEIDGFQVLEALGEDQIPYVIFVTAYDRYALRAFEVASLDYLLKPFNEDRFQKAIRRARERISESHGSERNKELLTALREMRLLTSYPDRLAIKEEGRIQFVPVDRIDWVEAQNKYVLLHAGKESYLLRETLTNLEERLDPRKFVRIHRSSLVNISRIQELRTGLYGEYHVHLIQGAVLKMSRTYLKKVHETLGDF